MKEVGFVNPAASDRLIPFVEISFWKTDLNNLEK